MDENSIIASLVRFYLNQSLPSPMAGFNQRAFCPPMCKAQVNIMTTPFVTLIIKTNTQKWEEHITEERFEGLSIERASRSAMFAAHEFVKRELPFLADSGVAGDELTVSVADAMTSLVCTNGKFSIIKNDRFKEFEEQNGLTEPSFDYQPDEKNIKALMKNLELVYSLRETHGSFSKFIANWPASDQIGLMDFLKRNGSRLGGNSGQWFIRFSGKDGFILTKDVISALINSGVDVNRKITSKRDLRKAQDAFNQWHDETNWPYAHLSSIAAYSIGSNYESEYIKEQTDKFSVIV